MAIQFEGLEARRLLNAQFLSSLPNGFNQYSLTGTDDHAYFIETVNGDNQLISVDAHSGANTLIAHEVSANSVEDLVTDPSGNLYFIADTSKSSSLWKTHGTAQSTEQLYVTTPGNIDDVQVGGSNVFFEADGAIWIGNGKPNGNTRLHDDADPGILTAAPDGTAYFQFAEDQDGTNELWKTDGTGKGTTEIASGLGNLSVAPLGNGLFFLNEPVNAPDYPLTEVQLFSSDGTPGGTKMFDSFSTYGTPYLTSTGDAVYFGSYEDQQLNELETVKSDGTKKGTETIKLWPEYTFFNADGRIYVKAIGTSGPEKLWTNVADQTSFTPVSVRPSEMAGTIGRDFYFTAKDSNGIDTFWRSVDGGAPEALISDFAGDVFTNAPSAIYYRSVDAQGNGSLYRFDPNTGSVSGKVFNDANQNGEQDSGEDGLQGWRVYLDLNGDGRYESDEPSARTTSSGHFRIDNVVAGKYTLRVVQVAGFKTVNHIADRITVRGLHNTTKHFAEAVS